MAVVKQHTRWQEYQREKWPTPEIRQEAKGVDRDRIDQLNEIGFVWDVTQYNWVENFNKLVKYERVHGTTIVKHRHDQCLYAWCYNQRQRKSYLILKNRQEAKGVDRDRIDRLNEIGFVWDVTQYK